MNTKVSIVIPVYNAEKTIKSAIDAVVNQSYPKEFLEVILIDDGSKDQSAKIIEDFLKLAIPASIRYIPQDHNGPAAARNRGWKEATGEIICFTDADCSPAPDWIASLISGFRHKDIAVVSGGYDIANKENILADCIWREIKYRHSLMPEFVRSFGSYNFAIKKEVLEKVGGFNQAYTVPSGEDNDLAYQILHAGFKIYFKKSVLVKHYFPEKLSKYLYQQYQHGFWRMGLYKMHPKMVLGDDYTHLKDALEPMLLSFIVFFSFLFWVNNAVLFILFGLVIFYIFLQFMVAIKICRQERTLKYLYLAYITFLRGFARTLGAWQGVLKVVGGRRKIWQRKRF